MALIKCPECKKKISDQCANCPQCGYPINKKTQDEEIENSEFNISTKKPFYKRVWIWIIAGVILVVLLLGGILFLNSNTEPMLDGDGKPVFVELTNEVYTNAEEYLAYHVNIKGEVFQVMSDDGSVKGIQVWLDPDTCEQNIMIYYNTDVEVKQGDYIICSGYIDSVTEYSNAFGANLYAPVVISKDLKKSTYIEVMSPTIETIIPENLKQEKYGYAFSVDKIEFAEKETRIYATATNNGKSLLYVGDAVIVQNGKQYNSTSNYDAEYEEIPYDIVKGASSSGVIVFPPMSINDFQFTIDVHSENDDEKLGEIVVLIGKEKSEIKTPWPVEKPVVKPTYPSAVGRYHYIDDKDDHTLLIYSDGTLHYESQDLLFEYYPFVLTGTWSQKENVITYSVYEKDGFAWNNPFQDIVYENGIDFLGYYFNRE